jgi:hypothetical protein
MDRIDETTVKSTKEVLFAALDEQILLTVEYDGDKDIFFAVIRVKIPPTSYKSLCYFARYDGRTYAVANDNECVYHPCETAHEAIEVLRGENDAVELIWGVE